MHETQIHEDRVFGLPETYPPLPLVSEPSTAFDLLSLSVDGSEVAYAAQGTVNHLPLVFLHGWGASHKCWRWTFSAFAPRYRCIAPDFPGFGLSERPPVDYTMDFYSEWVLRFLDAMRLPRVTLVSHSMGATIGLLFSLSHPDRVERLVAANPLIQGSTAFSSKLRYMLTPGIRGLLYRLSRLRWVRRTLAKDFTHVAPLPDDLVDDMVRGNARSTLGSIRSMLATDLSPRLSSLKVPTLAVGTDLDGVIAPRQVESVPALKQIRIAQTGHMPMVERPREFNLAVDEFLRSPLPPAPPPPPAPAGAPAAGA
jgi:pimeloyl-ACP methyl ester carboxylesterase